MVFSLNKIHSLISSSIMRRCPRYYTTYYNVYYIILHTLLYYTMYYTLLYTCASCLAFCLSIGPSGSRAACYNTSTYETSTCQCLLLSLILTVYENVLKCRLEYLSLVPLYDLFKEKMHH